LSDAPAAGREGDAVTDHLGEMLTVAETAKALARSTEQVRRYLREGALPGRRVGGQWFIEAATVEAFARQRRGPSEFAHCLRQTVHPDPLGDVIAIGGSGGGDIATGRVAYVQSFAGGR
jgi:excisionase family DNA binding protein